MSESERTKRELEHERSELIARIEQWLEWPLVLLAAVWLALLVLELVQGISPALIRVGQVIWIIFILEFVARFTLAPRKVAFLRENWVTLIALLVPAVRVLRVFRVVRALRGLRLVRVIGSMNRAMRSLSNSMRQRGLPYVFSATVAVLLAGAAGMYAFENGADQRAFESYFEALWWTAMLLTTVGSDYWPATAEGRVLTLFLSLYALGILGYVAGTLATYFIGREAARPDTVGTTQELRALHAEISQLRRELTSGSAGKVD